MVANDHGMVVAVSSILTRSTPGHTGVVQVPETVLQTDEWGSSPHTSTKYMLC